jgi:deazaflavin-dependent oxidoreductase (nitroreductase family)
MSETKPPPARTASPPLPPRWVVRLAWRAHRGLLIASKGHLGLWAPAPGRWGTLRLTTKGRRTGERRQAVLGYIEDDGNLVTMAMNGWAAADPAWWLNLQARPGAMVLTRDGAFPVHARRAEGEERERLWERWSALDPHLDEYAALRPQETDVVVLEPRGPARHA